MLMLIVALTALAVAGCTTPAATPTGHPTDTTPSALPTQTPPTATPAPTPWLSGYAKYANGGTQPLVSQVTCTFEAVYYDNNWSMPHALQTQYGFAHHGAIYQLLLANPTGSNQTIVAGYDIKSNIQYYYNGVRGGVSTSETFYDPGTKAEFAELRLAPGESRTVYMLAYITNDTAYETHKVGLERPSLDVNPQYVFGPI
ncbi:MAG: hypothetical protein A4E28_02451 [Methanocella sp. PtaU1.Bin125]|nr:MAG: hypothetical protein A4E28_02451 [Methanocella sp. PtaU1.Bin125]